jgi:WXG100 family type VII secretion target
MATDSGYEIDLVELLRSIHEMERCGMELATLLHALTRRVNGLLDTWTGAAATAQAIAHAEWESGCRDLREALGLLRAAADLAHTNYAEALACNLRMWEQLR